MIPRGFPVIVAHARVARALVLVGAAVLVLLSCSKQGGREGSTDSPSAPAGASADPSPSAIVAAAMSAQGGKDSFARVRSVRRETTVHAAASAAGSTGPSVSAINEAFDLPGSRLRQEQVTDTGAFILVFD